MPTAINCIYHFGTCLGLFKVQLTPSHCTIIYLYIACFFYITFPFVELWQLLTVGSGPLLSLSRRIVVLAICYICIPASGCTCNGNWFTIYANQYKPSSKKIIGIYVGMCVYNYSIKRPHSEPKVTANKSIRSNTNKYIFLFCTIFRRETWLHECNQSRTLWTRKKK